MRTFVVACISAVLLALVAAPALAQRDPFAPRAGEGSETQTGVEDGEGRGTVFQPGQEEERRPSDPLPETGGEVAPWLVTAYILGALGAGAIVLARSFGPQARARRG